MRGGGNQGGGKKRALIGRESVSSSDGVSFVPTLIKKFSPPRIDIIRTIME